MPGDPKECRKHARNCLRIAEASANAEITRTFVDLAHSWTRLALDLESAQALLVAVEDMENAGSVGTGRATTPRVNIVTPKKGRPLNLGLIGRQKRFSRACREGKTGTKAATSSARRGALAMWDVAAWIIYHIARANVNIASCDTMAQDRRTTNL